MRPIYLACVFACLASSASAQSFTVAWDHSPDPVAIGYTVYVGTSPGVYNVQSFDVGRALSAIINPPTYGTYYVALKSYDINGNRGAFSAEVSTTLNPPPPPPQELCNADGTGNGIDDDSDGQIDEGCLPPPPPPGGCVTGGIAYGVGAEATWQIRTRDYDAWLAAREREGWIYVSAFNQNRNQLRVTIRCQGL